MHYLRWHKRLSPARFDLSASGVPSVTPEELSVELPPLELIVKGDYGDPRVRELLANDYGVDQDRVLPLPGASCGIFVGLAAAVGAPSHPRGRVLMERPVYDPVTRSSSFLQLDPLSFERSYERDFTIDVDRFSSMLRQCKPSVAVMTNLHNPSGALIDEATMRLLVDACEQTSTTLVVDEVYLESSYIVGQGSRWSAATLSDSVVVINSLTKLAGFSGLRAGWIVGGRELIERARDVVDLLHANQPAPATALSLEAFRLRDWWERRFRGFHHESREVFDSWIGSEERIGTYPNYGALFECLRLPEGVDCDAFAGLLREQHDTNVIPGSFFQLYGHIRIGLGVPGEMLAEGLARISRCLDAY